jgi:hypothetical protein
MRFTRRCPMKDSDAQPTPQPKVKAKSPKRAVGNKHPSPPINPPSGSEVPPHLLHQKETCTCRPDQTPWWKYLLEVSAVAVGLCVAIIYILQLQQMTIATQATRDSVDAARDASHLDQRAWIGIRFQDAQVIKQQVGMLFSVPIEISNTGRTPAREVEIDANCTILRKNGDLLDLNRLGRSTIPDCVLKWFSQARLSEIGL